MAKQSKRYNTPSAETQAEALKIAKANQRPGQTKDQTKLIAQGIQKGIEQYKKQQKSKARDLDKKLKSANKSKENLDQAINDLQTPETKFIINHAKLPWVLLAISWLSFLAYFIL